MENNQFERLIEALNNVSQSINNNGGNELKEHLENIDEKLMVVLILDIILHY